MSNLPVEPFEVQPRHSSHREAGSTTFLALFMLALILFIGATVLMNATKLYNGNQKIEGWQEALNAAEAGADLALANARWKVVSYPSPVPTAFDPSLGWTTTSVTDPSSGQTLNTTYRITTPHIMQSGEGAAESWAVVTVDSPVGDNTTSPPSGLTYKGNQWLRVRSTGHARIPGLQRAAIDILSDPNARHGNALRKFNLFYDRATGAALTAPEAVRTIETILQPKTSWLPAVLAVDTLSISGKQLIDSYDPTDPNKSTNGQYDPTKRQNNGNIGTGGTRNNINVVSGSSDLVSGSAEKVYGNASTNGGSFTDPNNTLQSPGTINNNVNTNVPIIPVPTWGSTGQPSINTSVTTVSSPTTITVNSDPTKNYYKLTTLKSDLTIAGTGTINIWMAADVGTSATITINKGATLKIYFSGSTFHPQNDGGFTNLNQDPQTFQFYGVGTPSTGGNIDFHVGKTPGTNFYGSIYAPYRTLNLKYDGSTNFDTNSGFYGSFVGDDITLQGSLHYDEALTGVGDVVVDYDRSSYVEDPMITGNYQW